MKPSIFKSRKFWLTVADALISIASMTITIYLSPENAKYVLAVIAVLQPVVYALINGIVAEDVAYMETEAFK
jgi:hypothetical protein